MLEFSEVAAATCASASSATCAARDLSRRQMLATVVRLLDRTLIRVGNDEYARENRSYGLTTLRRRHVQVEGDQLRFSLPRQERRRALDLGRRPAPRAHHPALPGPARARSCSSTSTRQASARRSPRTTSTPTCARSAGATSPPRTSAPGAAPCSRRSSCARWAPPASRREADRNILRADRRRGGAPGQHARRVPQVLRASRRCCRPTCSATRCRSRRLAATRAKRRAKPGGALRRDEVAVLQFLQERVPD